MSRVPSGQPIGPINHKKNWARSHASHFGSPVLVLPTTIGRKRRALLDQGETNFCTAYGEATSNGYEKGVDFAGEFQTAAEGRYLGSPIINGADPYPSMQATYEMGSLPDGYLPFTLSEKGASFIADPNNWPPEYFVTASAYKTHMIPYYVDGSYDIFGNICYALYQSFLANENGVVKAFGFWYESWNVQAETSALKGVLSCPNADEQPVSRHRYTFIDFVTDSTGTLRLVAALTQGSEFGDGGFLYFDRQTINQVFANATQNGLGLYINRAPRDVWDVTLQWVKGILAYLAARVNLLASPAT